MALTGLSLLKQPLVAIAGRSSERLALHEARLKIEAEAATAEAKRRRTLYDETAFAMEIGDKPKEPSTLGNLRVAADEAQTRASDRVAQMAMTRAALSAALADDARARKVEELSTSHQHRKDRAAHGAALCKAAADLVHHWQAFGTASGKLSASLPNAAEMLDLDGAMLRQSHLVGAIKVELMRLGGDFMGEIPEPHKVEPMADKLARVDEYIRSRINAATPNA